MNRNYGELYKLIVGDYTKGDNAKNIELEKDEWKEIYDKLNNLFPEFSQADNNFYDEIVKNLKNEAEKLNKKLTTIREGLDSNGYQARNYDMNLYISTLKSLRETLDLISKYDWKLMYSEYGITSEDQHQVAVWEQNHDNQIRNHKVWNVAIKNNVPSGVTVSTDPMKVSSQSITCAKKSYIVE